MPKSMQERIIAQISRPPLLRNTHQLDVLLPWLRKKSELLRDLERNVLLEIVRNCDYLRADPDDVIITQGDDGDRLYIILSGQVSVYVDGQKTGEVEETQVAQNVEQKVVPKPERNVSDLDDKTPRLDILDLRRNSLLEEDQVSEKESEAESAEVESTGDLSSVAVQGKALKRNKYGRFVVTFESGKCFGEIALISRESKRNATIIADEDCSFLVIKRHLYNTTLKAHQEEEYAERRSFVNTHPLFKGWQPKILKLLEMSLIKETYSYDCRIVRQGEEWKGLYFIIQGNTKLMVEPSRHETQYPDLKPFKSYNDVFELELGRSGKKHLKPLRGNVVDKNRTKAAEHIFVKRHEGYKAAEERRKNRSIYLCNMGEGEMFGDVEVVMNLPSYHHTVVCTCETEVYCLNNKNFDRFVNKKYTQAMNIIRMHVETKLQNRSQSVQGTHVPLLRHLVFKMTEERKPVVRELRPLRRSKELPDDEILFEHLLEAFKHNRAELSLPAIPGSIYIRETMREKARRRHLEKQQRWEELKKKRQQQGRGKFVEKARTTKELKAALLKQRVEEEERERRALLHEIRLREEDEMRKMETNTINLRNFVVQFRDPVLMAQEGLNANNCNQGEPVEEVGEREKTFITEFNSRPVSRVEQEVMSVPEPRSHPLQVNGLKSQSMMELRETEAENGQDQGGLAPEDEDTESIFEKMGREQEARRAESKMRFIVELQRRGVPIPENPAYRDWETSDRSMRYLEKRIKQFMSKTGDPNETPFAPRLSRYENGDKTDGTIPRPGGRVICKPRACAEKRHQHHTQQSNSSQELHTNQAYSPQSFGTLTNHEHYSYKMVPEIKNYHALRKNKMYVQMALDDKREKWLVSKSTQ